MVRKMRYIAMKTDAENIFVRYFCIQQNSLILVGEHCQEVMCEKFPWNSYEMQHKPNFPGCNFIIHWNGHGDYVTKPQK